MEIEEGNEHMREVKAIKINLNVRYHLKSLDIWFSTLFCCHKPAH